MTGGFEDPEIPPPPSITEEVVEEIPPTDPNISFQPPAPTPAPMATPAPAPAPAPQGIAATQQQQPTANFEELFPFDSTGQAIQRRRSGIGSLV